jgi:hypothetical protein
VISFVSCRSYEEYVTAELAAQLILIPCLLHVLKPAYTNQESVSFEKGYRQVNQKYQDFKAENFELKIKRQLFIFIR